MAPPLSLFPPPLNPNVLSAPPSIVHRQKPAAEGAPNPPSMMPPPPMPIRPGGMQIPPPPGTTAPPQAPSAAQANPPALHAPTIEKRANITSVSGPAAPGQPGAAGGGATISAKPQIINPKTEVTRFVPTTLRIRRDKAGGGGVEKGGRKGEDMAPKQQAMSTPASSGTPGQPSAPQPSMKTKDQMYDAFMKEMEGLL